MAQAAALTRGRVVQAVMAADGEPQAQAVLQVIPATTAVVRLAVQVARQALHTEVPLFKSYLTREQFQAELHKAKAPIRSLS
ncbi:hypothetical protein A8L48_22855 [Rhizobium rhizogenes]|nr:hypothetical protein B0909_05270 [Rhizobium rhizogenes]OAM65832.1 hypothetical protein A8L48_22855 [Rhizobium rhizogenes]